MAISCIKPMDDVLFLKLLMFSKFVEFFKLCFRFVVFVKSSRLRFNLLLVVKMAGFALF